MGFAVSLFLIAIGAILTWGVADTSNTVNLDAVGVILMVVGLVGLLLTLLFWQSWWGAGMWRRRAYYDAGAPVAPAPTGRRYVVEEEEVAPPAPPAGGPPPPP